MSPIFCGFYFILQYLHQTITRPATEHEIKRNESRIEYSDLENFSLILLSFPSFSMSSLFSKFEFLITFRRVYYINICKLAKSDSFLTVCGKLFMVSSEHILSPQKALKKVKVEFTILSSSSVVDITDLETQL